MFDVQMPLAVEAEDVVVIKSLDVTNYGRGRANPEIT